MVEDFPLLPPTRAAAEDHHNYLRTCLQFGRLGDGSNIDENRRKWFQQQIDDFKPEEYPESIPKIIEGFSCQIYGHLCPVFLVAEGATETAEYRPRGRSIPFPIRARVARRDNYTCQQCGKHLKDEDLEFDHPIPLSKGGSSDDITSD